MCGSNSNRKIDIYHDYIWYMIAYGSAVLRTVDCQDWRRVAMVRFSRAKAAAAAPAVGAGQPAKEVALKDLVLTGPMPLGRITCIGRVGYTFGSCPGALPIMGEGRCGFEWKSWCHGGKGAQERKSVV